MDIIQRSRRFWRWVVRACEMKTLYILLLIFLCGCVTNPDQTTIAILINRLDKLEKQSEAIPVTPKEIVQPKEQPKVELQALTILSECIGKIEKTKEIKIEPPAQDNRALALLNELMTLERQKEEARSKTEIQTLNLLSECINKLDRTRDVKIEMPAIPITNAITVLNERIERLEKQPKIEKKAETPKVMSPPYYNTYPDRLNDAQKDLIDFMLNYLADEE